MIRILCLEDEFIKLSPGERNYWNQILDLTSFYELNQLKSVFSERELIVYAEDFGVSLNGKKILKKTLRDSGVHLYEKISHKAP